VAIEKFLKKISGRGGGGAMENEKRKIMIFGGTGYIGNHMAKASLLLGHPTFVYARPITPRTTPSKVELRKELQSMGATVVLVH
jgi:nucleoside-diphosphate-sugar epimerase